MYLLFLILFGASNQIEEGFTLIDKNINSDFNYNILDSINDFLGEEELLKNVFKPVKGRYIVMRFIRHVSGEKKIGGAGKNTELIMLKICPKTKMIDEALYFPLGWKEFPLSDVLQKSFPKIKLKNNLSNKQLKLEHLIGGNGKISLLLRRGAS
ncbi:MAG: hypothetical protein KF862_25610 [Chitinophagaceae bacterium]|nr:hypothetical protein [Chitinophagaceae bacterium]